MRDVHFALYADANLNVIDGCAIWLQSVATALSRQPRNAVTVVCKAGERRDLLTRPLRALPGVSVLNPVDAGRIVGTEMTQSEALDVLTRLDAAEPFDAFILRGFALCHEAATRPDGAFAGRLWAYLTDIPQRADELTPAALARLEDIARAARYLLCQTEMLRSHLESWVPGVAGKAILLEPMIPDEILARAPEPAPLGLAPLRLVYVGKYAPMWNTLEMARLTAQLREAGVPVELHMFGDKIHRGKSHTSWTGRMKRALTETEGVHWHRGMARDEVLAMLPEFHVALGWRAPELDDSLELSTKLLEYGAVGLPALVNRTPMHEELLGIDYPLFANSAADFEQAVVAARDPEIRRIAALRCSNASQAYTFGAVSARLQPFVERAVPRRDLRSPGRRPRRILVACHDFKFFGRIQEHLAALRGVELRVDAWPAIDQHDENKSQQLLDWADVIICEWCANNAVWYSARKRPHQRLIVRLHRFEMFGQYVRKLTFSQVDQLVFVGDYYRGEAMARLGWTPEKLSVIPNWVDTRQLDRPKIFGAEVNLGIIGIVPRLKRLDRAVTILEKLRSVDRRFLLHVKGKMPWEAWWIWRKPEEQEHYREVFTRINQRPLLRGAVHFDGFGGDVAAWLRKIGWVLSPSDLESFHLAPAEGMASRAVPLVLPWKGAEAIYSPEWIHADEDAVVGALLSILDRPAWQEEGERARLFVESRYSVERVCSQWEELVLDQLGAR